MKIVMLPLGTTKEIADANVDAMEKMLEHNEEVERIQQQKWDAMSDEEKEKNYIAPILKLGVKQCPRCRFIASPWWSMVEHYGLQVILPCFNEDEAKKLIEANKSPACASHYAQGDDLLRLQNIRFDSEEKCIAFWNSLIT